jgi:hypothetical protein
MNIGMLWFDNDPRATLEFKVQRAADYYRAKYGRRPNLCFVNPSMLQVDKAPAASPNHEESAARFAAPGLEIRAHRSVMPNHFWLGVNAPAEASLA